MCTIILGSESFFAMKLMAIHLNVKRKMRSKSRFPNFAPTSESSPVASKPGYSASLFSMPSLDFRQVGSCSKALKCWNGSSCDPKESFGS